MLHAPWAVILGLLSLATANPAFATGDAASGRGKARLCAACHGTDGNHASETIPRLAGQVPQYLEKQLHDFRSGHRRNCGGFGPGRQRPSDTDIADIAAFFAGQRADTKRSAREATPLGMKIYLKGRRSPGFMPACTGCHGPAGGGQSPRYIAAQLTAFRSGSRSNDRGAVMRRLAEQLSDEEIAAVAAYVADLDWTDGRSVSGDSR